MYSRIYSMFMQAAAAQKVEAKPVKEKGPLPAEHLILQSVLEKLANQCLTQSNNPVSATPSWI